MPRLRVAAKALQKGCFSLLATRAGAVLVVLTGVLIFHSMLDFIDRRFGTSLVCRADCRHDYSDNIGATSAEHTLCTEPIDAVYTWVNGSEPQHQAEVAFWQALQPAEDYSSPSAPARAPLLNRTALSDETIEQQSSRSRFEDHDELRYSLRSLERYAPWIRHVYIVTNGQVPTWLDTSHPRITIVPHSAIFVKMSDLPTFSSPAIEAHLHRIPGLSRRFLYLNDDTFFAAPVVPDDFYSPTRGHRIYFSWPVPNCAEACPPAWLTDGYCDRPCNTSECDWDGGDCLGDAAEANGAVSSTPFAYTGMHSPGGTTAGHAGRQPRWCAPSCNDHWIGDRFCDAACNVASCGFDGTDCGMHPYDAANGFVRFIVNMSTKNIAISRNVAAFALDLQRVFPPGASRIAAGTHESPSWVRTATLSQPHKLLIITVDQTRLDIHRGRCGFYVEGTALRTGAAIVRLHFNVSVKPAPRIAAEVQHEGLSRRPAVPNRTREASALTEDERHWAVRESKSLRGRQPPHARDHHRAQERARAHERHSRLGREPLSRRKLLQREADHAAQERAWSRALDGTAPENHDSTRRKLLDMFGDSLKYGNNLMSRRYGSASRKVPAHMVHMIDREVVDELWRIWPVELAATSASKFRSKRNVQYAFMHFYHIIHAQRNSTHEAMFEDLLDHNGNGYLDGPEVRRVALMLWEQGLRDGDIDKAISDAIAPWLQEGTEVDANASASGAEASHHVPPPPVTLPSSQDDLLQFAEEAQWRSSQEDVAADLWAEEGEDDGDQSGDSVPDDEDDAFDAADRAYASGAAQLDYGDEFEHSSQERLGRRPLAIVGGEDNDSGGGGEGGDQADGSSEAHPDTRRSVTPTVTGPAVRSDRHRLWGPNTTRGHDESPAPTLSGSPQSSPQVTSEAAAPKPPEFENIDPMTAAFHELVQSLVQLGVDGYQVGKGNYSGRRIRPAFTGKMTIAHFRESHIAALLMRYYGQAAAFRHVMEELDQVTFIMVRDNVTVTRHNMDHILFKRPKFLCVNDNMNHSHPNHPEVIAILHELFEAYFPLPSSFELPKGVRNPFTRLQGQQSEYSLLEKLKAATQQPGEVLVGRRTRERSAAVAGWVILIAAWLFVGCLGRSLRDAIRNQARQPVVINAPEGAAFDPFALAASAA